MFADYDIARKPEDGPTITEANLADAMKSGTVIGKGTFGSVSPFKQLPYAVKQQKLGEGSVFNEVTAMLDLRGRPYIVQLRHVIWFPKEMTQALVVTRACSDLLGLRMSTEADSPCDASWDPVWLRLICREMVLAVYTAHSAGWSHNDIKPGNFLVVQHKDKPPYVMLGDFGNAVYFSSVVTRTLRSYGTYVTPESLETPNFVTGPMTDLFALGISMAVMAGVVLMPRVWLPGDDALGNPNHLPASEVGEKVLRKIDKADTWTGVDPLLVDLIKRALGRYGMTTADELLNHDYFAPSNLSRDEKVLIQAFEDLKGTRLNFGQRYPPPLARHLSRLQDEGKASLLTYEILSETQEKLWDEAMYYIFFLAQQGECEHWKPEAVCLAAAITYRLLLDERFESKWAETAYLHAHTVLTGQSVLLPTDIPVWEIMRELDCLIVPTAYRIYNLAKDTSKRPLPDAVTDFLFMVLVQDLELHRAHLPSAVAVAAKGMTKMAGAILQGLSEKDTKLEKFAGDDIAQRLIARALENKDLVTRAATVLCAREGGAYPEKSLLSEWNPFNLQHRLREGQMPEAKEGLELLYHLGYLDSERFAEARDKSKLRPSYQERLLGPRRSTWQLTSERKQRPPVPEQARPKWTKATLEPLLEAETNTESPFRLTAEFKAPKAAPGPEYMEMPRAATLSPAREVRRRRKTGTTRVWPAPRQSTSAIREQNFWTRPAAPDSDEDTTPPRLQIWKAPIKS